MQFQFSAKSTDGALRSGVMVADSADDVRERLRDEGLFVMSVVSGQAKQALAMSSGIKFGGSGVKKTDVLMLTSQLSIMSQAGVDLGEALQLAAQDCPNESMKKILQQIHGDVSAGQSISEALGKHSSVFGDAYVASVAAGEASGTLNDVLLRLAQLLKHEIRLRSTLKSVLAYPIVLIGVAFMVLSALVFIVLPQFGTVFEDLGEPPPVHTQILLDSATFLRAHFLAIAVAAGLCSVALAKFWFTDKAARYWDGVLVNLRFLKSASRPLLSGRTFRLLGTLLESGIPLLDGIRLCRTSVRNRFFRELFDRMEASVLSGKGIGEVIARTKIVPPGAAQMISTAERTGRLGDVMVTIGSFYEEEGEQKVRDLTKVIEPLIIILMGAVVGLVVMAVMLPLLDVSTASGRH
jgi:type II secretory pathway component PulF